MEAKWAPPEHEVFKLVPDKFSAIVQKVYADIGRPNTTISSFWDIYLQLLEGIQKVELVPDFSDASQVESRVLEDLENAQARNAQAELQMEFEEMRDQILTNNDGEEIVYRGGHPNPTLPADGIPYAVFSDEEAETDEE